MFASPKFNRQLCLYLFLSWASKEYRRVWFLRVFLPAIPLFFFKCDFPDSKLEFKGSVTCRCFGAGFSARLYFAKDMKDLPLCRKCQADSSWKCSGSIYIQHHGREGGNTVTKITLLRCLKWWRGHRDKQTPFLRVLSFSHQRRLLLWPNKRVRCFPPSKQSVLLRGHHLGVC